MALSLATAPMGMATAGPIKLGVNGFGRIGRQVVRIAMDRDAFELKHINGARAPEYLKYLLEYDTVHGRFNGSCEIGADGNSLIINGNTVTLSGVRDPAEIPWKDVGVDYVCESTGAFTSTESCLPHIAAGAKKVIISAPAKDADTPTIVVGVNTDDYDSKSMQVVSCASCTTNGLAPLVKVVNEKFGIKQGLMTTVHAATASQLTVDGTRIPPERPYRHVDRHVFLESSGNLITHARATPSKPLCPSAHIPPSSPPPFQACSRAPTGVPAAPPRRTSSRRRPAPPRPSPSATR